MTHNYKNKNRQKISTKTSLGDDEENKNEIEYYKIIAKVSSTDEGQQMLRRLDTINDKASSVLTHISIMIAVLTGCFLFFFGKEGYTFVSTFLFLELCGYIILTMFALRSVFVTCGKTYRGYEDMPEKRTMQILVSRRLSLRISIYGTMILTILLIFTLLVEFPFGTG